MTYINFVNNLFYFEEMLVKKTICLNEEESLSLKTLFNETLVRSYTDRLLSAPYGLPYMLRTQKINVIILKFRISPLFIKYTAGKKDLKS